MKNDMAQLSISAFLAGRSVFITGATGFIGKALIEKLLRSCPDIVEIFLLMRPKRGMGVDDRLKKLLNNALFDKLRNEQPSSFDKLIPVAGDVAAVDLGLSPADRQMLIDRVSVIFHVAASVRFDDSLKKAIFINTRSTRDICILANSIKNLAVLVHVSSTYTQIDKRVVDEILYPTTDIDWRRVIETAESVDEDILRILTTKYMGQMPNTYVFTKRLAEQVISDYSESLPCVVVRPSIVISTVEEPVEGWLDNFNGPIGSLVGGGKGILRVFYADSNIICDYVPVDFVVKLMIIATWKRSLKTVSEDKTVHVYNCSSNKVRKLNIMEIQEMGFDILREIPFEKVIWSPYTTLTKNRLVYYVLMLLLHIIPAICIDNVIKLFGARPILLNLQRKVYVTNNALAYFLLNEWSFINTRTLSLSDTLSDENKDFKCNYLDFDTRKYFRNGIIGSKIYLLNEDMNNLEAVKLLHKRINWLNKIIKTAFVISILWIFYSKNILYNIANILIQHVPYADYF